mmetsp:Transcript_22441/g.43657  ORF Transcript_22441/g.43657 Transcript_22441/m.43657 type:complete len:98 (-) Transcript_22441:50-343(-)
MNSPSRNPPLESHSATEGSRAPNHLMIGIGMKTMKAMPTTKGMQRWHKQAMRRTTRIMGMMTKTGLITTNCDCLDCIVGLQSYTHIQVRVQRDASCM